MKAEKLTEERDGVVYVIEPVKWKSKQVGFAPTIDFENLADMTDTFDEETVFNLAIRQHKQDAKNAVRMKFGRDKVSATRVVAAIAAGEIKVEDIQQVAKNKGLNFTEAASSLMGVGEDAKIEPEKIHWDVL